MKTLTHLKSSHATWPACYIPVLLCIGLNQTIESRTVLADIAEALLYGMKVEEESTAEPCFAVVILKLSSQNFKEKTDKSAQGARSVNTARSTAGHACNVLQQSFIPLQS